jgi:enoyl-[acyl-carrier protein] reductase II
VGVATTPLVTAVSNAGGLGVGIAPSTFIEAQIRETRELTDQPFGVNIVMVPMILAAVNELLCWSEILTSEVLLCVDKSLHW